MKLDLPFERGERIWYLTLTGTEEKSRMVLRSGVVIGYEIGEQVTVVLQRISEDWKLTQRRNVNHVFHRSSEANLYRKTLSSASYQEIREAVS